MWNAASLRCCSAASDREGEEGERQGTALLLRLSQFLFNCLLIYLIMAATRTSGQAASVLSLRQLTVLKLVFLDKPPSLLDLHQEQPKHKATPSSSASPLRSSEMSQLAGATLLQGSRDRRTRTQGVCRGTECGEASPGGLNPQIRSEASMAGVTASRSALTDSTSPPPHCLSSAFWIIDQMFCSHRSNYADHLRSRCCFRDTLFHGAKCHQMTLSGGRFLLTVTNNFFLPDADVNGHKLWKISDRCATFSGTHKNREAFWTEEQL